MLEIKTQNIAYGGLEPVSKPYPSKLVNIDSTLGMALGDFHAALCEHCESESPQMKVKSQHLAVRNDS